jgi:hypothetical protein
MPDTLLSKPYIRVVINEAQLPLIIRAVRSLEVDLRVTAHKVEDDLLPPAAVGCRTKEQALSSLRGQARQLSRWHKFVVREAKERGWYASDEGSGAGEEDAGSTG